MSARIQAPSGDNHRIIDHQVPADGTTRFVRMACLSGLGADNNTNSRLIHRPTTVVVGKRVVPPKYGNCHSLTKRHLLCVGGMRRPMTPTPTSHLNCLATSCCLCDPLLTGYCIENMSSSLSPYSQYDPARRRTS
jgi:hypothetical protein